jgi:hypothetical protein
MDLGVGAGVVVRGLRSDTLLAREQRASESMPASVRRPRRLVVVDLLISASSSELEPEVVEPPPGGVGMGVEEVEAGTKKLLRILTTSSNTSSSHKLSLKPSEASMRISSCSMGSVNVCAWVRGVVDERGPSWRGVLNCWEG